MSGAAAAEAGAGEAPVAPVVMRASGLHKRFGGQVILDEAEFELRRGEIVLLRGPNGSGKTTLLNILTGNLEPDAGHIEIAADAALGTEDFRFPPSFLHGLNPVDHFTPERIANEGVSRTWQDIRLFPTHSLARQRRAGDEEPDRREPARRVLQAPPPSTARRATGAGRPTGCCPASGSAAARPRRPT